MDRCRLCLPALVLMLFALHLGSVASYASAAIDPWIQQVELTAPDGPAGEFGRSIALSADGNTALISAPNNNSNSGGEAYVFTRSGSAWTQQTLTPSDSAANDYFGGSVALSGDGNIALIGAFDAHSYQGAAYVFMRSGSTWTQQQELTLSAGDVTTNDFFGESVALSGDGNTALISAGGKYIGQEATYVFTRSGSTWSQQQKLTAFSGLLALSADGSTALIGAWDNNSNQRAAYVFMRSGSTWSQQQELTTPYGVSTGALSADGNTALIGAPNENPTQGGEAYVFTRSGSTWSQQQELTASDGTAGYFGAALALSGDGNTALIGAYYNNIDRGAAYVFTRSGSTWSQQQKLRLSDKVPIYVFGESVALSGDGNTALISAEDQRNTAQGAVYVFNDLPGTAITYISDLTWVSATNGWGPVEKDMSNGESAAHDGHTISLHGVTYAKGLGVHAPSTVTYNLGGQYLRFTTDIGIDDETGGYGSVIFQVWGDGTKLYDSGIMTAASNTQHVDIGVAGVNTLQLIVLVGNGTAGDHADWAGSYLVTSRSAQPSGAPPTVPGSLTALTVSSSEIDLTWSASTGNAGVVGYKIYRNETLLTTVTTGTSYADKGLTASTTYNYQVSAYDAAGNESEQAGPVPATTFAAGSGVYISDLSWASATNGWGPVERDMSNGESAAGDGHEITIDGVKYPKGIGCHAQSIITYNLGGNYSMFISDIGIDDEVAGGSVEFQVWGDGTKLYDSGTSPYVTSGVAARHVSVNVAGVTTLTLKVLVGTSSFNDHADWAGAHLVTGSAPPPDTTPPTVPSSLTATAVSSSEIDLTWSASTDNVGVAGYYIYRNGNSVPVASVTTGTSYADTGLTAATTYNYTVAAYDAAGNESSQSTPPVQATTLSTGSGGVYISDLNWTSATNGWGPVEKDMSNGEQYAGDGHEITIDGVKYAKGIGCHAQSIIAYNLAGKYTSFLSDIGIDDEVLSEGGGGSVEFQVWGDGKKLYDSGTTPYITSGQPAQHVNVSVAGVNTLTLEVLVGSSPNNDHADWAGAYLVTGSAPPTDTTPPSVPGSLTATAVSSSEIDLTWSASTDNVTVTGYKIYRNGSTSPLASVTTGTSYTDKGLAAATTYSYTVSAYDAAGNESAQSTPPVSATTLSTGSGTTYISDLTWTSATNGWGPVEKDMSNGEQASGDGHTISLHGVKYAKGIGCHAQSIITYNLAGKYSQFTSDIGIDDETGGYGSVIFQVWGDGTKLYDSGIMGAASATQHINTSVAGVHTLQLQVNVGSTSNGDHADWAGAQLSD